KTIPATGAADGPVIHAPGSGSSAGLPDSRAFLHQAHHADSHAAYDQNAPKTGCPAALTIPIRPLCIALIGDRAVILFRVTPPRERLTFLYTDQFRFRSPRINRKDTYQTHNY